MKIIISQGENFERAPAPCGKGQGQECVIADRGLSIKFFTIIHNHDHPNRTMDIGHCQLFIFFDIHGLFPGAQEVRSNLQRCTDEDTETW